MRMAVSLKKSDRLIVEGDFWLFYLVCISWLARGWLREHGQWFMVWLCLGREVRWTCVEWWAGVLPLLQGCC